MFNSLQEVITQINEGQDLNMVIDYDDVRVYNVHEEVVYQTKVYSLLWEALDCLDIPFMAVK